LHTENDGKTLSYQLAPVEQHHAIEDDDGVTLQLPVLTALQLYSEGILAADAKKSVELAIAGQSRGAHYLHWPAAGQFPPPRAGSNSSIEIGRMRFSKWVARRHQCRK
jgi:hypothetical protein